MAPMTSDEFVGPPDPMNAFIEGPPEPPFGALVHYALEGPPVPPAPRVQHWLLDIIPLPPAFMSTRLICGRCSRKQDWLIPAHSRIDLAGKLVCFHCSARDLRARYTPNH